MNENVKVINVGKDFSRYPFGRHKKYSHTSGEKFRDEFLVPALRNYPKVEIHLDDAEGYGSGWLEEAFGGTVRLGFDSSDLLKRISFVTSDHSLPEEIASFISAVGKV